MGSIRRIAVFCGSRSGVNPQHLQAAQALGAQLAQRGIGLVYGGAQLGLMGAVAEGALGGGGQVIGVMPGFLHRAERLHPGVQDMRVVDSMHARKALMADLADAFVALPGGYGTLDELFEIVTWSFLQLHSKPVGLLNSGGYFDAMLKFIDHANAEGFVTQAQRALLRVAPDPAALLQVLGAAPRAPARGAPRSDAQLAAASLADALPPGLDRSAAARP
jgi:uncharacterized protein (TIGR00730 family)